MSPPRFQIRPLWRHYFQNTHGVIFVVDSNDRERLDDSDNYGNSAKDELHRLLSEDNLQRAALLVYANKQDLPNAISVAEISERLGLPQLRNREWHIQGTSAPSGDGLYEGLDWLAAAMKSTAATAQAPTPSSAAATTAVVGGRSTGVMTTTTPDSSLASADAYAAAADGSSSAEQSTASTTAVTSAAGQDSSDPREDLTQLEPSSSSSSSSLSTRGLPSPISESSTHAELAKQRDHPQPSDLRAMEVAIAA